MARSRKKEQYKGIYCLETEWFGRKDKTSVEPVLRLLETTYGLRVPYIHRNVATREELEHRLREWLRAEFNTHPILYLAFHGRPGQIDITGPADGIGLAELATVLEGRCKGRVLHFGSCGTLNLESRRLREFRQQTKALALMGYKSRIDWLPSTVLDLLLLGSLQKVSFTRRGIRAVDGKLRRTAVSLRRSLKFRLYCP